jgi:hypothetical protein
MTRLVLVECPELEEDRPFGRVVEALTEVCPWIDAVRPGVCTLPVRGPARYFGDERAVLDRVTETVTAAAGGALALRLGVAEGVFAAALAARAGAVVPVGETAGFLAPWPIDVLGDAEIADLLVRLGLPTLGDFAALPAADVVARLGAAGARYHRIARALDGELPGYRVPGMAGRLRTPVPLTEHQPGFWGGASAADERAAEVLTDLQRRLGPEAVTVAVLGGGRGPSDRCRFVPWRPTGATPDPAEQLPWPGRVPPPAPARVLGATTGVEVVDRDGVPVGVTGRGLLTGRPDRVSVAGGPWAPLAGWSAPWPVEERWWSRAARRRAARLQVVAVDGRAYLLLIERGRWWLEAAY